MPLKLESPLVRRVNQEARAAKKTRSLTAPAGGQCLTALVYRTGALRKPTLLAEAPSIQPDHSRMSPRHQLVKYGGGTGFPRVFIPDNHAQKYLFFCHTLSLLCRNKFACNPEFGSSRDRFLSRLTYLETIFCVYVSFFNFFSFQVNTPSKHRCEWGSVTFLCTLFCSAPGGTSYSGDSQRRELA